MSVGMTMAVTVVARRPPVSPNLERTVLSRDGGFGVSMTALDIAGVPFRMSQWFVGGSPPCMSLLGDRSAPIDRTLSVALNCSVGSDEDDAGGEDREPHRADAHDDAVLEHHVLGLAGPAGVDEHRIAQEDEHPGDHRDLQPGLGGLVHEVRI